ncbi:MAG: aldo/keto reductase [Clostridia bacterium]|nr:aldo/keto reductase [Clostridia bacterium]
MQYRINPKNGDKLSALGFGCMRFTRRGGAIDQDKANFEMKRALDLGVNYFDTAYVYAGSEACLGQFMKQYGCRDQIRVATKLPQYLIRKSEDMDRNFREELKRLDTDHVDYYLMHMLNDKKSWERLCGLGIREWIAARKRAGEIRNIGFSFHGGAAAFKELVDAYDWEFCQIQFNYMDEHAQAGIDGLCYAHEKGLPVIIMEPMRGGRLATGLNDAARAAFARVNPDRTPVDWALRWIWNHPEATVVLSGMNDAAQVEENCRVASESQPETLTERELAAYGEALQAILASVRVNCTGCNYCQPCPKGVNIPTCFANYNASYSDGYVNGLREYFMCTTLRKDRANAGLCVKCGQCEKHCPQGIAIRDELDKVKKRFETPLYKVGAAVARKVMKY